MALNWDANKDILKDLWLTQDKNYEELREEMKRRKFIASKNQYVAQFKKWGWRKNLTQKEWETVGRAVMKRKREGRESEVFFKGARIPAAKVRKGISRNMPLTATFISTPTPLDFEDIRIRTPPLSVVYQQSIPHLESLNTERSAILQVEAQTSVQGAPGILEPQELDLMHERPNWIDNLPQTEFVSSQSTHRSDNLPYFEFLDLMRSLNLGESNFRGNFLDQAPSPLILPSNPFPAIDFGEPEWSLGSYCQDLSFETSNQSLLGQQNMGHFYKSFANLLVSTEEENQDQLDANKLLQEQLPQILRNMPERVPGERETIMESLLGPPLPSSALHLLEVVVYLYSNNSIPSYCSNTILQWIVETVPFPTLSGLLRLGIPTLQQFMSALLWFGIYDGNVSLVEDLLTLDNVGLKDLVGSSGALGAAISNGDTGIVKLVLSICAGHLPTMQDMWRKYLLDVKLTVQVARLLFEAGANVVAPVSVTAVVLSAVVLSKYDVSPLLVAISFGKLDLSKYLIGIGADVNYTLHRVHFDQVHSTYPVVTPLRLSVTLGSIDLLCLLLNNNANVDEVCECGDFPPDLQQYFSVIRWEREDYKDFPGTALQAAAAKGYTSLVLTLLQHGANINEPAHGPRGQTALHAAAMAGSIDTVEALLQRNADVNALGTSATLYPRTALLTALESNDAPLVNLLLKYKADPNTPAFSYHGITVLEAARAQKSSGEIISLLLAAGAKDATALNTPARAPFMKVQLVQAIVRGDVKRIHQLVDTGVEVDMEIIEFIDWEHDAEMTRGTLLHWAIKSGVTCPVFRCLVQRVRDVNENMDESRDENTLPPVLLEAVKSRRTDIVAILLEAGADINVISMTKIYGKYSADTPTALHIAAYQHDIDMLSMLLTRGANVQLRVPYSNTPLHSALRGMRTRSQEFCPPLLVVWGLLLDYGSDINALGENYETLLEFAVRLPKLSPNAKIVVVRYILNAKAEVNHYSERDRFTTALEYACREGFFDLVMLLLDNGADINVPAKNRGNVVTALGLAAGGGHIEIVRLLLSKGAKINDAGSHQTTTLTWAASFGRLDVVQILINAGAETHLPLEERYLSALRGAKVNHQLGVVSLLQRYRDEAMEQWNEMRVGEVHSDCLS